MAKHLQATVAIPTFCREEILLQTIELLLKQRPTAAEILVIDQTPKHTGNVKNSLEHLANTRAIRWIRLHKPSITRAMNTALEEASSPVILFVDDDIIPSPELIGAHLKNYGRDDVWGVAGQVLQPGEEPANNNGYHQETGFLTDLYFPFSSNSATWVKNGMAGNLSVRKDRAIQVGGFDENFIGVAYRFESEFCKRLIRNGGKIWFDPEASIRHLRNPTGGTRAYGNHLCSISGAHGVGDYYFAFLNGISFTTIKYAAIRPFREVATRYHMKHPWCIPVKFIGEISALLQAIFLAVKGPSLPLKQNL